MQRAVLEPAMQGRDMIGRARTGTGKTLAFGIPILDKIMRYNEAKGLVHLTLFLSCWSANTNYCYLSRDRFK